MKIAFVNQPWNNVEIPIRSGSIAIWIYEVARRLATSHQVLVYSRRNHGQPRTQWDQGVEYRRVRVTEDDSLQRAARRVSILGAARRFDHAVYHLAYILRIAYDLRRQRPDIVHLHNLSQFAPVVRALNPDSTIVLHMHCEWLTQIPRNVAARRLASVDHIVGCSRYIADTIRSGFPERTSSCHAVLNGVDVAHFRPRGASPATAGSSRTLLFVGRVSPEKGVHVLLEAFSRVLDTHPDARLEIVGGLGAAPREFILEGNSDPLVAALDPLFNDNYVAGIRRALDDRTGSRVDFLGELSYLDLKHRYLSAEILVVPSVWNEPFGLPAVEAMACGLPVVAASSGGLVEIVNDGVTGFLVKRADAKDLARALTALLSDTALRESMGAAGHERARRDFSWNAVAQAVMHIYESGRRTNEGVEI